MNTAKAKAKVEELLSIAGVRINGQSPWDMQVYNDAFFTNALPGGISITGSD